MPWIKPVQIQVTHNVQDEYFDKNGSAETVTVTGLVQPLSSAEELSLGVGQATRHQVKVHVKDPEKRNVFVGDTFLYHDVTYTVTDVDDGIMGENKVRFMPYMWTFTGKVNDGSSTGA